MFEQRHPCPFLPAVLVALSLLLPACVSYRSQEVSLTGTAAAVEARAADLPSPLALEAAVRFAVRHDPRLRALARRAEAEGLAVAATAVEADANFHDEDLSASVDPVALLGRGPRGRARALAARRRAGVRAAWRERRLEVVVSVAECFTLARVLASLPPADVEGPDPGAFVSAGLASPLDGERLAAARAAAAAERAVRVAARRANDARLRALLGVGSGPALVLAGAAEAEATALPDVVDEAALLRHPRLGTALAAYRVADAALRLAVARQVPGLKIGGQIGFDGGVGGLVAVRLPVGASRAARAAAERREAARLELEGALLERQRDASASLGRWRAAQAAERAARTGAAASAAALRAARSGLEVEPEAFGALAEAAAGAAGAASIVRRAAVESVRARFDHARAVGIAPEVER